jgi:predicted PurR-regulated permease PerM
MNETKFGRAFLLLLVVAISAAFLAMIRQFLLTILLAGIFTGLAHPLYRRIVSLTRGRKRLASLITLFVLFVVVGGPLLTVAGVVTKEAVRVSEAVRPWIEQQIDEPSRVLTLLDRVPGAEHLRPYRSEILTKAGELVGSAGAFLVDGVSAATKGTVSFFVHLFLLLYSMFFLLVDGRALLDKMMHYLPLHSRDERQMIAKFVSVTRATLKGTLLIGIAQGTLGGLALWAAGIQAPFFWGTAMIVLSIIPGVGTAIVWGPAAIFLFTSGHTVAAGLLAAFCAGVVGSIDNVLRPRLVGRDTEMHELLVLFSTLGGLLMFGVLGFIVGPILAALFVAIWEIYAITFRDLLPD